MSREDKSLTVPIIHSSVPVKLYPGDRVRLVRATGPDQADITLGDIRAARGGYRTDGKCLLDINGQTWLIRNGYWQVQGVLERAPKPLPTEPGTVIGWGSFVAVLSGSGMWRIAGSSYSRKHSELRAMIGDSTWKVLS